MPRANKTRQNRFITEGPVRADQLDLTPEERKILADPNWVTEDEADVIVTMRRQKAEKGKGISLQDFLKKHGYKVE
jgi:hypothetical protein